MISPLQQAMVQRWRESSMDISGVIAGINWQVMPHRPEDGFSLDLG